MGMQERIKNKERECKMGDNYLTWHLSQIEYVACHHETQYICTIKSSLFPMHMKSIVKHFYIYLEWFSYYVFINYHEPYFSITCCCSKGMEKRKRMGLDLKFLISCCTIWLC